MRKNNHQWLWFLAICFIDSLSAYIRPDPCHFGVQAEFLYLFPTLDDTYFLIDSSSSTSLIGDRINHEVGYQPAYRLEGIYGLCNPCQDLRLRWTFLIHDDTKFYSGNDLWPSEPISIVSFTGSVNGLTSSTLDFRYQCVELIFDQYLVDYGSFSLFLSPGLEYVYISAHEDLASISTFIQRNNYFYRAKSFGPELGLGMNYAFWESPFFLPGVLSFAGSTTGSLLISRSKCEVEANRTNAASFLYMDDYATWRIVPAWNLRLGFNYLIGFCCLHANLELGYEFQCYFNAIAKTRYMPPAVPTSLSEFTNFNLHGPYGALGVSY